jgi:hypothetical protein
MINLRANMQRTRCLLVQVKPFIVYIREAYDTQRFEIDISIRAVAFFVQYRANGQLSTSEEIVGKQRRLERGFVSRDHTPDTPLSSTIFELYAQDALQYTTFSPNPAAYGARKHLSRKDPQNGGRLRRLFRPGPTTSLARITTQPYVTPTKTYPINARTSTPHPPEQPKSVLHTTILTPPQHRTFNRTTVNSLSTR